MKLIDKFLNLKKNFSSTKDSFCVELISDEMNHRIGVTEKGQPVFFIKTIETNKNFLNVRLQLIELRFNQKCELISESNGKEQGVYSTATLKTDSEELTEYFLTTIEPLLKKIGNNPASSIVKREFDKLIDLFKNITNPPKKTIQGLWAEMFFIEQSKNIDYTIRSWHISPNEMYDFNDGNDKIEIKSTSSNKRTHRFNQSQLNKMRNTSVFVGSVFVLETDLGKSINNLFESIKTKTNDDELIDKVNRVIAETLGKDIERIYDSFYDYSFAKNTKAFYSIDDIPKIKSKNIPKTIFNIKFDCDLEGLSSLNTKEVNSKLLKAF